MLTSHREFLAGLSGAPGVYRMLDGQGLVLYVGKARNLRKRVASYFRPHGLAPKVAALMALTENIEVTVTHTENEALLLEHNLIKTLRPRYNVLLRDDKSYPYLYLGTADRFPRLAFHRGARRGSGRYFGPFPNSGAVRESLNLLQRIFRLRDCEDSVFRHRERPCLQFQIGRCRAPCVDLVSEEAYQKDVRHATMVLEGRNSAVVDELVANMERASASHQYEEAAFYRDQIGALRQIQERQYVSASGGDADAVAVAWEEGVACVTTLWVRGGSVLGSRAFFPKVGLVAEPEALLAEFVAQYYLDHPVPAALYLDRRIPDMGLLQEVLSEHAGRKVVLSVPRRGLHERWVRMVSVNAADELRRRLAAHASQAERFEALKEALGLPVLNRIECFDISHSQGEATIASCVAFDRDGPVKSDYRRFNITGLVGGDDYGAIAQAVSRRYAGSHEHRERLPDLVLIDGGLGQLNAALAAVRDAGLSQVQFLGVAKGPARRAGEETLVRPDGMSPLVLPPHAPALHLIQNVRDEAHRFAITGHRQRRDKKRVTSSLEGLPGIGQKRRQALLHHLGGLQVVARAGVEDLTKVPGISLRLAQQIYDAFHEGQS